MERENMLNSQSELAGISIHVRCPDCFKLYAVQASDIESAKPQFQCTSCSKQFWMPFPECLESAAGLIGFPVETSRPSFASTSAFQAKPFSCPKCGSGYNGGQAECEKCGVIFQKFVSRTTPRSDFSASKELKALWDAVVLEYENPERHRGFIDYGFADGNIDYVTRKYADILESNPGDEIALRFQNEIHVRVVTRAQVERRPKVSGWQNVSLPRIRLSPILFILAGVLIAAGLIVPGSRNLVGFGSSVLFLALAIRFYFTGFGARR